MAVTVSPTAPDNPDRMHPDRNTERGADGADLSRLQEFVVPRARVLRVWLGGILSASLQSPESSGGGGGGEKKRKRKRKRKRKKRKRRGRKSSSGSSMVNRSAEQAVWKEG